MKILKSNQGKFFTEQEVRLRARQEMERTGLSAEELIKLNNKQVTSATPLVWRVIPSVGLMSHWLTHRPDKRLAEPSVQDAVILSMFSAEADFETLLNARLFKCLPESDIQDSAGEPTATCLALRDKGVSPKGYYSSDICRGLSFINGPKSPAHTGDTGWLIICDKPFGAREIPDNHVGLHTGDGRRVFNNDFLYQGAHVLALAKIKVTKVL